MAKASENHLAVLEAVISSLQGVGQNDRSRLLKTILTYFNFEDDARPNALKTNEITPSFGEKKNGPSFSDDRSMSPKEFMLFKQPQTDVERIACLAFYLTHYKNSPYFKTIDLTQTNTEAAQHKFSNAATSANNAIKMGYLAPGPKGTRQISAIGERFVQALPDRDAAREVMSTARRKRWAKKKE